MTDRNKVKSPTSFHKPHPITVYNKPKSLILSAPNNIIFELFDTIVKTIGSDELQHFIEKELKNYLKLNWTNKTLQTAITRLRRDLVVDRRAKSPSLPPDIGKLPTNQPTNKSRTPSISGLRVSSPTSRTSRISSRGHSLLSTPAGSNVSAISNISDEDIKIIDQVYQHIIWRIRAEKVTQITSLIIKFAIEDGYKRGAIKTRLFDDVKENFADWRSEKLIKLYSFGNLPPNDQKLLLNNTDAGNLHQYIANYVDGSEKKQNFELIKTLVSALRDKTNNCIYITNDLNDAVKSIETGALRCVFIVDRANVYLNSLQEKVGNNSDLRDLIVRGKLYFVSSLNCIQFVPDPATRECC